MGSLREPPTDNFTTMRLPSDVKVGFLLSSYTSDIQSATEASSIIEDESQYSAVVHFTPKKVRTFSFIFMFTCGRPPVGVQSIHNR